MITNKDEMGVFMFNKIYNDIGLSGCVFIIIMAYLLWQVQQLYPQIPRFEAISAQAHVSGFMSSKPKAKQRAEAKPVSFNHGDNTAKQHKKQIQTVLLQFKSSALNLSRNEHSKLVKVLKRAAYNQNIKVRIFFARILPNNEIMNQLQQRAQRIATTAYRYTPNVRIIRKTNLKKQHVIAVEIITSK